VTTINDDQFTALCNLLEAVLTWDEGPTILDCANLLYHDDDGQMTSDDSQLLARVIMAYLGLRFADDQPVANALVEEVRTEIAG
jgi:hypothetical protein